MHFSKIQAVVLAFGTLAFTAPTAQQGFTVPTNYKVEAAWTKAMPKVKDEAPIDVSTLTCAWFGTSPFCEGECPSGWRERERDRTGDGKKCFSGYKSLCCTDLIVSDIGTSSHITAGVEIKIIVSNNEVASAPQSGEDNKGTKESL